MELAELIDGIGTVPAPEELELAWPIDGVIHPVLTDITGQPEVGKTTLLQTMCRSVLDGSPWAGKEVAFAADKRILFGCEDVGGVSRLRHLFGREVAEGRLIGIRLLPWTDPRLTAEKVRRFNVGLVILDSVYSAVLDVNDQAASGHFLATVRQLGVPVVVVHHESKKGGGRGPSGAQTYRAAYRHTIRVKKVRCDRAGLDVEITISGNDIGGVSRRLLTLERDTARASLRDESSAVSQHGRPRRVTAAERTALLDALVEDEGLAGRGLGASAIATLLLGGPPSRTDPDREKAVADRIGGPLSHRRIADLLRSSSVVGGAA